MAGERRENREEDIDHRVDVLEATIEDMMRGLRNSVERLDGIEQRIKKLEGTAPTLKQK